jgi:polysaccharide pyruvyl transferase WcaK-like protein
MPMSKNPNKTILLIGTHGQYNWGDDILLDSFLHQLGPEFNYFINSYDPESTAKEYEGKYKVNKVFHTTNELGALPKIIFSSDVVFFAGGTIIRELYKSSNRNKYSSMLMILGLVFFSKIIARKKVIMSNIGVGPIPSKTSRFITKILLSMVDFASFRDNPSLELVKSSGVKNKNMRVVPDCVFVNTPEYFYNGLRKVGSTPPETLTLALNINYDIANLDNWNYFISNLAKSLNALNTQTPIKIIGLPMQIAFNKNNDVAMLEQFKKHIPDVPFELAVPKTRAELGSIIHRADIVLAERLHALIISAILSKPFIPLTYDVKVRSLVEILNMNDYSVDINSKFPEDEILKKVKSLIKNREAVAKSLNQKYIELNREASDYFSSLKSNLLI